MKKRQQRSPQTQPIDELAPQKVYTIYLGERGKCRLVTGRHTTVNDAIRRAAKILGATDTDLEAIKTILVDSRTIRTLNYDV